MKQQATKDRKITPIFTVNRHYIIALRRTLHGGGFDTLFSRPFPYVMAVHQEPTRSGVRLGGHLHAEFYPPLRTAEKLKYPAGSEQGAGTFISDVLPEESAEHLRAALARSG